MVEAQTDIGFPAIVTAGRSLASALVEYSKKPYDPQRYWNFQEAHWSLNRFAMGLAKSDVVVSDVPWTEDLMRNFMGKNRFRKVSNPDSALFLPEVASTAEGLELLAKAYPQMGWNKQYFEEVQNVDREGNPVRLFGHLRTEATIDAPHTRTNEDQARQIIANLDRQGQTLNVYAEAGNQSKLLTSRYLDEIKTWVRVLNSRLRGQVVNAHFLPYGYCHVGWHLWPDGVRDSMGVRSVGV